MKLPDAVRLALLTPKAGKLRVVLDTDTFNEIDDQFALTQMILSPERFDVVGIYAAPFCNTRAATPAEGMQMSYDECHRLLHRLGHPADDLVFKGVTEYVGRSKHPRDAAAVQHLIETARSGTQDDPLYIIAIAAISNIASALLMAPDIKDKISVVWLGAHALHWPHIDEFNLRQDIGGAQVLFDSCVPLVLIPCMGVTTHLSTTVPEIERHVEPYGEIGKFLAKRFKEYSDEHLAWSKPIWDMAAVAYLLNERWTPNHLRPTPIITDNMTWSFDENRPLMRYVSYVQRDAIFRDFFLKLRRFHAV